MITKTIGDKGQIESKNTLFCFEVRGFRSRKGVSKFLLSKILFITVLVVSAGASWSKDIAWTGAVNSEWTTPGNWDGGAVPGVGDTAIFTSSAALGSVTTSSGISVLGEGVVLNAQNLTAGGADGVGKIVTSGGATLVVNKSSNSKLTVPAGSVPVAGDVIDVIELGPGRSKIAHLENLSAYPARIRFTDVTSELLLGDSGATWYANSITTSNWVFESEAPAKVSIVLPPYHYLTQSVPNPKQLTVAGSGLFQIEGGDVYTLSAVFRQTGGFTVMAGTRLRFCEGKGDALDMHEMRGPLTVNGLVDFRNNPVYADGLTVGSAGSILTSSTQVFTFGSDDRDGSFSATLPISNSVVKVGSGTLTVSGVSSAGAFSLAGGTLRVTAPLTLTSLTMAEGTVLVIDGTMLTLGRFAQNGAASVSTVNGGQIVYGGDSLTEIVRPNLDGDFVKVGTARTTIYEPSSIAAKLHVSEGELAFSKFGLSQRYWKWTFEGVSNGPAPLESLGKIWLYGADGSRVGDGIKYATYGANADLMASDSYKGKATWICSANTNVAQVVPTQWHQDCFSKIDNLFIYNVPINNFPCPGSPIIDKANPDSYLGLEIRFRDTDGPIVGYNFGLTTATTGRPKDWTVEVSDDGINWTMVDIRTNVTFPSNAYGVFCDGTPYADNVTPDPPPAETFHITGYLRQGLTPLANPLAVQVDDGAKLDLCAFTGGQSINDLTYDAALGGGEIVNAAIAANGTLRYFSTMGKPASGFILPYVFTDCSDLSNFASWSVVINGKPSRWNMVVRDGKLMIVPPGSLLIIR